jgi:hypothetical protein
MFYVVERKAHGAFEGAVFGGVTHRRRRGGHGSGILPLLPACRCYLWRSARRANRGQRRPRCQLSALSDDGDLEEQIGDELVASRLEAMLAANESEPSAQLKHEALQVGHERVLEFGFSDPSLQAEKFQSSPVRRSDQLGSRMPTQPPPSGNPAARSPHKTAAT